MNSRRNWQLCSFPSEILLSAGGRGCARDISGEILRRNVESKYATSADIQPRAPEWRATHTSRILLFQNCSSFSVSSAFKWSKIGKANDKFITSRWFLSSDTIPTSSREKESDELLYKVLVARYGPQSVASASGWSSIGKISSAWRRRIYMNRLVCTFMRVNGCSQW